LTLEEALEREVQVAELSRDEMVVLQTEGAAMGIVLVAYEQG
jgi:hypothetical protein